MKPQRLEIGGIGRFVIELRQLRRGLYEIIKREKIASENKVIENRNYAFDVREGRKLYNAALAEVRALLTKE